MKTLKIAALGAALASVLMAGSCYPAADVASRNLSTAADNFEVARRITFYNGITDKVVLVMEGYCSIGNNDTSLRMSVTCKTGPNTFIKDIVGLSDNIFFASEQLENVSASTFHYRVVLRPQSAIPDVDFQGSADELLHNYNGNE